MIMIIESFFGVFGADYAEYAPSYMKNDVQELSNKLNEGGITIRTRARFLRAIAIYAPNTGDMIDEKIVELGLQELQQYSSRLDKEYAELVQDIESMVKHHTTVQQTLNNIQQTLNNIKIGHDDRKFINDTQVYIDNLIKSTEDIRTILKEYKHIKYDKQPVTSATVVQNKSFIANQNSKIISKADKDMHKIWSEYTGILRDIDYIKSKLSKNSCNDDKQDDTGRNYSQKMLEEICTNIETLKNNITNNSTTNTLTQ